MIKVRGHTLSIVRGREGIFKEVKERLERLDQDEVLLCFKSHRELFKMKQVNNLVLNGAAKLRKIKHEVKQSERKGD